MKTLTFLLALAVPFATACNGQVEVSGHPTTGAGGAGDGGAGGGGGGAGGSATCEALVADLTAKIAAARLCTSVGTWDECDESAVVTDECGCHAPLNHERAQEVAAAVEAAAAVTAAGCVQSCDFNLCVGRYNDPNYNGGCVQQGEGPGVGVCEWAGAD
jgi:hypothetical protein